MATHDNAVPLEFDTGSQVDSDSSLGDIESQSQRSESINSQSYEFRFENGRRFHGYDYKSYLLPNDEIEQDRLDLQHQIFRIAVDGKLHTAPLSKDIHNVLDIGCGTGLWSIEMADEYPSASVLGVDLSPIQPENVPVNCSFQVDNLESEWAGEPKYDYVHSRAMVAAIRNWPNLLKQCFDSLKPGGYLELQDFVLPAHFMGGGELADSLFMQYNNHIMEATKRIGVNTNIPTQWQDQLTEAGFVDIHVQWFHWPVGPWAKGRKNKLIGKLLWQDFFQGIDTVAPLLTKVLGWDEDKTQKFLEDCRVQMKGGKYRHYIEVGYWYARKPDAPVEKVTS